MPDPAVRRSFEQLVLISQRNQQREPIEGTILAVDPGHTTGIAVFNGQVLLEAQQLQTKTIEQATTELARVIRDVQPIVIVVEDYRVYKWKTEEHANSDLLTSRIIGCIETLTTLSGIEVVKQPANVAKHFCTDQRLREWGMYITGLKHARDAIRHGCYFQVFGAVRGACQSTKNDRNSSSSSVG